MTKRIIEISVNDEYVVGSGVVIGAAGADESVILRVAFGDTWAGLNIYATFRDSKGESPTVELLMPSMLVLGETMKYDVVVPAAATAHAGKMSVVFSGFAVSEVSSYEIKTGTEENIKLVYRDAVINTTNAYFRVLPSDFSALDVKDHTEATVLEQVLSEINGFDEKETERRSAETERESAEAKREDNFARFWEDYSTGKFKGEKGDPGSVNVVDGLGDSETAVVSQKATTKELNDIRSGNVNDRSLTAEKMEWLEPNGTSTTEEITSLFGGLVNGMVLNGVVDDRTSHLRTDYIDITKADCVRVKIKSFTPGSETTERFLWVARFDKDKNFIEGSREYFRMYSLTEDSEIDTDREVPPYIPCPVQDLLLINTTEFYQHGMGKEISVADYNDGTAYIILFNLSAGDTVDMSVEEVTLKTTYNGFSLPENMMPSSVLNDIENLKKNQGSTAEDGIILSDYVDPLIDDIALAAKAHMKEDSLCIVLFTDTHYVGGDTCFPTLIAKKLAQATNASAILHLGDLAHLYTEDRAVGLEIFQRHSKILQGTKIPYLQVVGNHDDGQMYLHTYTKDFTADNYIKACEMYHATTKQSRHYIKLGSTKGWYYMDDKDSRTRLIVLNSHDYPWVVSEDGTLAYDSNAASSISAIYSTEQIEWLANTALNFADKGDVTEQAKWSVLAFAHMGTMNWAPINYLFTAFWAGQKKTDFSQCGADTFGLNDYNSIEITNDFSLVGRRKIAFLMGDIHLDKVTGGNYPLITFLDCKYNVVDLGTPNEAALSVLVVTPSEGKITELRFGEGTKTVDGVKVAHDPLTDYDNYRIVDYF